MVVLNLPNIGFKIITFLNRQVNLLKKIIIIILMGYLLFVSKLQTCFQWVVEPPFELSPLSGVLEPGMHCRVSVTFKPQQALVYQTEASCTFGKEGKNNCTVLLKGLCKFSKYNITLIYLIYRYPL